MSGEPVGTRVAWRLWVGLAALSCVLEAARIVSEAMFVSRIGLGPLPGMFALQALLRVGASWVYVRLADGRSPKTVFGFLLLGLAVFLGLPAAASAYQGRALWYATVYAAVEAADTIVKIHWGVFVLQIFAVRDAGRFLPIIYTASALGRAGGGALVRTAAPLGLMGWSVPGLVALLIPLAAAALLSIRGTGHHVAAGRAPKRPVERGNLELDRWLKPLPDQAPSAAKSSPQAALRQPLFEPQRPSRGLVRATLRLLRNSRLLQALVVGTVLLVGTRLLGRYVSLALLRLHLDETALARMLGTFSLVANVAALCLQVFVVPRLSARLGPQWPNAAYGAALVAGVAALPLFPSVASALAFRFVDVQLKSAVRTPIAPMFYYPFSPSGRAGARALVLGVVSPVATAVVAALTQALRTTVGVRGLGLMASLLGIAYLGAVILQNREYETFASGQDQGPGGPGPARAAN